MPPPWIPLSKRRALERMVKGFKMRYPQATWYAGPPYKQNGGLNSVRGVVCHSMVGSYAGALSRLEGTGDENQASWHFSVLKDGRVFQHYETTAQAWHAGSAFNNKTVGIEHEGGLTPTNEPLTPPQLQASISLVQWLSKTHGFPLERKVGLWEHNEVSDSPTACPSKRIPWEFYVYEEVDMAAIQLVWNPDFGRLYVLGQGDPRWVTDPQGAADLQKAYGQPTVALSWKALQALGAK